MRIRRKDGEAILGIKRGDGEVREEVEIDLETGDADRLWPLTEGRRVRKTRHRVDEDGMTIEVDVFHDELDGLVTAEVEFASEAEGDEFEPPEWIGRELTGEREFENQLLAEEGLPEGLR